jgi:dolichol-phosphate mannosyltransferase
LLIEKLFGDRIPARFVIFGMIGAMGVLVHFAVLFPLLERNIVTFLWAQSIATLVAMTFNFFFNNMLTYRDRRLKGAGQLIKGLISFYAICSIGTIANVGIANVLFRGSYAWWLAAIAGVLVGALWNYVLTSVYTWKPS